jgi:hypothetical protein
VEQNVEMDAAGELHPILTGCRLLLTTSTIDDDLDRLATNTGTGLEDLHRWSTIA